MEPLGPNGPAVLCAGAHSGRAEIWKVLGCSRQCGEAQGPPQNPGPAGGRRSKPDGRPAGPRKFDAPDEHPFPAGTLPGGGGGHARWPAKGYRVGGVPLFQRTGWGSGTGGGGLFDALRYGGAALCLFDLCLCQLVPWGDFAGPVCPGGVEGLPVCRGGTAVPVPGSLGLCGVRRCGAAPSAAAGTNAGRGELSSPAAPPGCGPLPYMCRLITST